MSSSLSTSGEPTREFQIPVVATSIKEPSLFEMRPPLASPPPALLRDEAGQTRRTRVRPAITFPAQLVERAGEPPPKKQSWLRGSPHKMIRQQPLAKILAPSHPDRHRLLAVFGRDRVRVSIESSFGRPIREVTIGGDLVRITLSHHPIGDVRHTTRVRWRLLATGLPRGRVVYSAPEQSWPARLADKL